MVSVFIIIIAGQLLNFFFPHRFFTANQLALCFMLVSQLLILKKLNHECQKIRQSIQQSVEPEVTSLFNIKTVRMTTSGLVFFIAIFFVLLYICTMFVLGSVEVSITGIYGALLGVMVFYTGILAYVRYISLTYFAYDLRNVTVTNYFFYHPSLTDWLRRLAALFSYIEKWFLVLGVLYTAIYAVNLPSEAVSFNGGIIINANNNTLLIITWGGILIFFVLAFPILTFFTRGCIKREILILKNISIQALERKIRSIHTDSDNNIDSIQKHLALIKTIDETPNYPLKSSRTIFDGFYSMLMAAVTLISPMLPIFEGVVGIFQT